MISVAELESLKARLSEYDPASPRCTKKVAENRNYAPDYLSHTDSEWESYTVTHYSPCCRTEGHEGECRNYRRVMGWPGYQMMKNLISTLEYAIPVWVLHSPYPDGSWRGMEKCLGSEDADILIFYSREAAEVYRAKVGAYHFHSTPVYMVSPPVGEPGTTYP